MSANSPSNAGATVPLLAMRGITKMFPGVLALDGVDFTLRTGEIHGLMGENGAGKSTLIKVLTGVCRRDGGTIQLQGRTIAPHSPLEAQALGISTVYQEVNLIPYLSVAENLFLGREPRRCGLIRWPEVRARAAELLGALGLSVDVHRPLNGYPIATQQMVAIARALDTRPRVLILDEPTSSLDAREVAQLFTVLRRLKTQGLGMIFITHFLNQVYELSDRITVLRNGRLVDSRNTANFPHLDLVSKMVGKSHSTAAELTRRRITPLRATEPAPRLRAERLGRKGSVEPLDIRVEAGEVVGLAGLLGSGRSATARLLFGIDRPDSGVVELAGRKVRLDSPRRAVAHRLGLCPEDRKVEGLFPQLSIRDNIVIALQARYGWHRPLGRRVGRELTARFIQALRIATPDADRPVGQLSGGNQQKVILARWLASQARLLILDEPTRGIDVGAKGEVEQLMAELCRDGLAIVFISSELDEVVRNCHRALVLRDRRKVGELAGDDLEVAGILRLIASQTEHA